MPNGDEKNGQYNSEWCDERHSKITTEFDKVWDKIRRQDNLLWAIFVALLGNLGGVIATLVIALTRVSGA